ncbi:MAG TPA: TlpA disulfide reductase family protein [Burkholderiales bacterium]|nr:TlpA disulfide reductase family protein [Burkholderiales bacterium]
MSTGLPACAAPDRRRALRLLALLALAGASPAQAESGFTAIAERPQAPDFSLADEDGTTWRLSGLKGKVVLVNFWATWCPPCRRELPSLERLRQTLPAAQTQVLAINVGESWDTVAGFIAGVAPAPGFPVLYDTDSAVLRAWAVRGLPTTYVVDRRGRIALRAVGGREFDQREPANQIRALLQER